MGEPTCQVLLLSLAVGGVGLNLVAASHVVHFDRWYNPAREAQATDRCHRIGQHRTVCVHHIITSGTFEERLDKLMRAKSKIFSNCLPYQQEASQQIRRLIRVIHSLSFPMS